MSDARRETYWEDLGDDADAGASIEIPDVPDDVVTWIRNHPDAGALDVLAKTGATPDLRDDVADAIDVIHGDAGVLDDEDDAGDVQEASDELGEPVSKLPEIRRPMRGFKNRDLCPSCRSEVGETLGAPVVPTDRLGAADRARIDGEKINVRGFRCDQCNLVLAVDPDHGNVDLGPSSGWIPVAGVFADGSKRDVLVPTREVNL